MKTIEILLTYNCNSGCVYCFLPKHRRGESVGLNDAATRMAAARREGADGVYFSGGEPTLYKGLPALAKAAVEMGFSRIVLRTNGMRISYEAYLDELIAAGVNGFCVSVKSHLAEVHDRLSRVEGGFALVMKGLDNLAARKSAVEVDFLVHALNYKSVEEAAVYLYERSIRKINFQFISSYFDPSGESLDLKVKEDDAAPYILNACRRLESLPGASARIYYISPCFLKPDDRFFYNLKHEGLVVSDTSGHTFPLETTPMQGQAKLPMCEQCGRGGDCTGFRRDYIEIYGAPDVTPFP